MVTTPGPIASVGILSRGDPEGQSVALERRLHRIFEEIGARGAAVEPIVFSEGVAEQVRRQLLSVDGVLVWVDTIVRGLDRALLDGLLRDVAAAGVFVSAHPDVILKMG